MNTDSRVVVWSIRVVTLAIILGAWELYGRSSNPALFAPVSKVVEAFRAQAIDSGELWSAAGDSLRVLVIGFSAAIVVGTVVGLLMGRYRVFGYIVDPYVSFLYAIPMAAIVPLVIIWIGIGVNARILIVFLVSVTPVLLNSMAGAREVSPDLVDVARNYGATNRQIVRSVVFPSVLPYIFTGINVGIGSAIIGMVLGEILVVIRGLGGLVVEYSNAFQPAMVFVPLLTLILLSVTLTTAFSRLRAHVMPWSPGRD